MRVIKNPENSVERFRVILPPRGPRHRVKLAITFLLPVQGGTDSREWIFTGDEENYSLFRGACKGIEGESAPACLDHPFVMEPLSIPAGAL